MFEYKNELSTLTWNSSPFTYQIDGDSVLNRIVYRSKSSIAVVNNLRHSWLQKPQNEEVQISFWSGVWLREEKMAEIMLKVSPHYWLQHYLIVDILSLKC